jgi:hypothetical protein
VPSLPDENPSPLRGELGPSHFQTNSLLDLTTQQASGFLAYPKALHKISALFPPCQVALQVERDQSLKGKFTDNHFNEGSVFQSSDNVQASLAGNIGVCCWKLKT